ncbi:MAG: PhoPQ-activated pathogenicity-related family protein [Phycisphaeraceae bacterium]
MRTTTSFCIALFLLVLASFPAAAHADEDATLADYVQRADGSYAVELVGETELGPVTVYTVELTSQTWQGRPWKHWLSIIVPEQLRHDAEALLVIAGGRNGQDAPDLDRMEARLVANIAGRLGAPAAVLQQVPNQPLFDGRREDELIAYTFDRFLDGEPTTDAAQPWPALLPMVKSAVRAMDGVRDVLHEQRGLEIERFIVAGGSKRGWTTYLTAAIDRRVKAMAPLVFDILDMPAQIEHQRRSFGDVSEMIRPYTDHEVIQRMDTPRGRALRRIVDPFHYRQRFVMPKLIVLGTNDPYWTVDAPRFYLDHLPAPTYLHYVPNAGHGLGPEAIPTLMAFLHATFNDQSLPMLDWRHPEDDAAALHVQWDRAPGRATLYQARSDDRDFRDAEWTATRLDGEADRRTAEIRIDPPEQGWLAYFIQVEFDPTDTTTVPYALSTPVTVLPDELP